MSITSSSLLAEMNIRVWTAAKVDKSATAKVVADNNASRDAAQVRKNLMAGTSMRKNIADYAAQCRVWHNSITLPWFDRGARLLPTKLFLSYKSEANVRRDTFNHMVNEFLGLYPTLVQHQQQQHAGLGTLFDEADYPSVDELATKFGFSLVFNPIPETSDFRLQIGEEDLAELREQYDASFNARLADAMRTPWERLHKLISGMSEKLADNESDEVKKRYHDSFVTNAREMCEVLRALNLTNDPQLEEARRQLELTMLGADIDNIKESADTRKELKRKLDTILGQFDW